MKHLSSGTLIATLTKQAFKHMLQQQETVLDHVERSYQKESKR